MSQVRALEGGQTLTKYIFNVIVFPGGKMKFIEFEDKVKEASRTLKLVCPNGNPSEERIEQVLRSVGFPFTSGEDDQVRKSVVTLAYRSTSRGGTVVDRMLLNAWKWRMRQDVSSGVLVSF